jgi:hypothetical protein
LVVILLGFYYLAVVKFIPQIAFTLKARKTLEAAGTESKKSETKLIEASNSPKALLSSVLAPKTSAIPSGEQASSKFESVLKTTILATRTS